MESAASSEADELAQKQCSRWQRRSGGVALGALANVEIAADDFAFSTADFGVAQHPLRGYTKVARKKLRAGRVLRDEPLLVFSTADHRATR